MNHPTVTPKATKDTGTIAPVPILNPSEATQIYVVHTTVINTAGTPVTPKVQPGLVRTNYTVTAHKVKTDKVWLAQAK